MGLSESDCNSSGPWGVWHNETFTGPIKKTKQNLERLRGSTPLWQGFAVQDKASDWAKKHYSSDQILTECGQLAEMETEVQFLRYSKVAGPC